MGKQTRLNSHSVSAHGISTRHGASRIVPPRSLVRRPLEKARRRNPRWWGTRREEKRISSTIGEGRKFHWHPPRLFFVASWAPYAWPGFRAPIAIEQRVGGAFFRAGGKCLAHRTAASGGMRAALFRCLSRGGVAYGGGTCNRPVRADRACTKKSFLEYGGGIVRMSSSSSACLREM